MKNLFKSSKSVIKSIALMTFIALLIPGISQASDKKYKFKMVVTAGDRESPKGKSLTMWAKRIEEISKGRMKGSTFFQGELGGQQEVFDQLIKGNVDMLIEMPQSSYDVRIGVLTLPYLVTTWEEAEKALNTGGWLDQIVQPIFKDMGLKYFGPYPEAFTGIATKGKYVTNYKDAVASGLKLRSIPVFPISQSVTAMGFQAVPIDWNEVYTSIQTGVVDGDSGNNIYWDYEYFRDLLNYFVLTKHRFSHSTVLMSDKTWSKLDDEDKKIIARAAQDVIDKQFVDAKADDYKYTQLAIKSGMKYIVPTDAEIEEWADKVRGEVWPMAEQQMGKDLMKSVWEKSGKAKKK